MRKSDFLKEINMAINDRPRHWRCGQAVFNYIDSKYGIAKEIQYSKGINCFYDDGNIGAFVDAAYDILSSGNVHDFPGDNMIEE